MSSALVERAQSRYLRERYPRVVQVTSPGVGLDWTLTVPGGVIWIPLSIRGILTTSATVINRVPQILMDDGASVFYSNGVSAVLPANTTGNVGGYTNVTNAEVRTADFAIPIPRLQFASGWRIRMVTSNIQGGDQWSSIFGYVIEILTRQVDREEAEALRDNLPSWSDYLSES